jgi:carbamoyl-phosphate synthase small subunit
MKMTATAPWTTEKPTALLVLADGTVIEGRGLGATGSAVAEVCFNTALTGYQEILTDPSYAGQIVTFTFPHIGNIGTNDEDIEDLNPAARRRRRRRVQGRRHRPVQLPRRAGLDQWLKKRGIVALSASTPAR